MKIEFHKISFMPESLISDESEISSYQHIKNQLICIT